MENSTTTTTSMENAYLESLTEKEKVAYNIAKQHLGSTFDLVKSCGFIEFKEKSETKDKT